jgi:hypothetical protein
MTRRVSFSDSELAELSDELKAGYRQHVQDLRTASSPEVRSRRAHQAAVCIAAYRKLYRITERRRDRQAEADQMASELARAILDAWQH